jgi:hypothetical protein
MERFSKDKNLWEGIDSDKLKNDFRNNNEKLD